MQTQTNPICSLRHDPMTFPISKDRLEKIAASPEFFGYDSNFK
jgi:hypothetical protein